MEALNPRRGAFEEREEVVVLLGRRKSGVGGLQEFGSRCPFPGGIQDSGSTPLRRFLGDELRCGGNGSGRRGAEIADGQEGWSVLRLELGSWAGSEGVQGLGL